MKTRRIADLEVSAIGLCHFHRPDPRVPFADSVGAIRDLLDAGTIRLAGVTNANPDQIRGGHARSSQVFWGITCGEWVPCATYW